jgi:two-component system sensor kinase FixL
MLSSPGTDGSVRSVYRPALSPPSGRWMWRVRIALVARNFRAAVIELARDLLKSNFVVPLTALLFAATAGRLLAGPHLPENLHYIFFVAAAGLAWFVGGARSALLAVLASVIINMAFLREWEDLSREGAPLTLLLSSSLILALLGVRANLLRRSAEAHANRLARAVGELDLLLDSAADCAICMLDPLGRIVHWNEGAALVLGWRGDEAIGHDLSLFSPARTPQVARAWLAYARVEGRHDWIGDCERRDGSHFPGQVILTAIGDAEGDHRGFGVVIRNLTIERQIEEAVRLRETQLRFILAAVPDAAILLDDQGIIQLFSPAAEQMFGCDEQVAMGNPASTFLYDEWQGHVAKFLASPNGPDLEMQTVSTRVVARRFDQNSFPAQLTIGTVAAGRRRLFTVFVRDLTEQERTHAMVESLQMEVLHGARLTAMGTMASTLAHELNQPMTAMANYVEGCRRLLARSTSAYDPRIDEGLAAAAKEAVRAGRFISHLREFVARGETMLAVEQANEVIASGLALVSGLVKEARITLKFEPAEAVEIFADRVQIQQVIINLVRNAVEATRHGDVRRITVALMVKPDVVQVNVDDCGAGFSPGIAEQLFDSFVGTKEGGLGVGLSICRTIVEAHGGQIWATSMPGSGASFHFTLCRKTEYAHGE